MARLNVRGSILEFKTGDRFLSRYNVLPINSDRIVLAMDESYLDPGFALGENAIYVNNDVKIYAREYPDSVQSSSILL